MFRQHRHKEQMIGYESGHCAPKIALAALLLCCGFLVAGQAFLFSPELSKRVTGDFSGEHDILSAPLQVGLWAGKPLEVEKRAFSILETDDVSLTEYRLGKEVPVWMARVGGLDNRAAFHPPELCYIGSHFEILERKPMKVIVNGQRHTL
ncbi:MAG: EpsI family protein, partial [Nitrososphaera sp.]|nr:EpsI family protein [Nitrososphaera sp.]